MDTNTDTAMLDTAGDTSTDRPRTFHAFISYSHALDSHVAAALQLGIQRFAVPWYELRRASAETAPAGAARRALRVFRDKTNLSAAPSLWPSIVDGLAASEWFILMASPTSARSPWVRREVAWWLQHRRRDRLLIAWTDGSLSWGQDDFDWSKTNALPPELKGALTEEPLWIDLRPFRPRESAQAKPSRLSRLARWPLAPVRLGDAIADFVAPIRGVSKDELVGAHVRQRRFATALALTTGVALASLATWAVVERSVALQQRNVALANQLVAESATIQATQPGLARQYVAAAAKLSATPQVRGAVATSSSIPQELHTDAEAVAYSRDGRLMATVFAGVHATESEKAKPARLSIYDASSLTLLYQQQFDRATVSAVTFSPTSDVLAFGMGSKIALWDVSNPKRPVERQLLSSHEDIIKSLSYRTDGRLLASGSRDGTVGLWTTDANGSATWANKVDIARQRTARMSVSFQPSGSLLSVVTIGLRPEVAQLPQRLADAISKAGTNDAGILSIWDMSNVHHEVLLAAFDDPAHSAVFTRDGRQLVTTGDKLQLWTFGDSGYTLVPRAIPVPSSGVQYSEVAISGSYLSAIAADGFIRLWDISKPDDIQLIDSLALSAATHLNMGSLTFSPDATKLALCSSDSNAGSVGGQGQWGTLRIWNIADARQRRAAFALRGHTDGVSKLQTSPDHQLLVSADKKEMRVWSLADVAHPQLRATTAVDGEVTGMAFSPSGRLVAVTMDNKVRVHDLTDPTYPRERGTWQLADRPDACPSDLNFPCEGHISATAPAFLDERHLAVGDMAARVSLFDVDKPSVQVPLSYFQAVVWSLNALRIAGRMLLAVANNSGTVELWDATDFTKPGKLTTIKAHSYQIGDIAVSETTRLLATASRDGTVRLMELAPDGKQLVSKAVLNDSGDVNSVAFNPSATMLATLGRDHNLRVYDVHDLRAAHLVATIALDNQSERRVIFLRDDVLATGTEYGAIDIWDLDRKTIGPDVCAGSGETITPTQWQHILPDLPYDPPCDKT